MARTGLSLIVNSDNNVVGILQTNEAKKRTVWASEDITKVVIEAKLKNVFFEDVSIVELFSDEK